MVSIFLIIPSPLVGEGAPMIRESIVTTVLWIYNGVVARVPAIRSHDMTAINDGP